jgi:glycosyltransferase involved in cell wall biosynthesis
MSYAIGFVMEQTLGHVTHYRNLRQWAETDSGLAPEWLEVEFSASDRWERLPGSRSNWTLRASLRARDRVRETLAKKRLDGLFFHTQVTALFSSRLMARIPTVVSLDATPLNVDTVGGAYNHAPSGSRALEALKNTLNQRSFRRARHIITWCDWAKSSLVADYGIEAGKITVIPPGIDLERWRFRGDDGAAVNRPLRLLFVGGDFQRKGGDILLKAFRENLSGRCELDIVTRDPVDAGGLEGVRVHHGLNSNAPALLALYEAADVFVFPTLGDCLPIAVMEAMASGLPVVSTCVGAIGEEVEDGLTGILVPPGSVEAVSDAVLRMAASPAMRHEMGAAGRSAAEAKFDGARNYRRVISVCRECVNGR